MPVEVRDLDEGRGSLLLGSGTVTDEEYVGSVKAHLAQPKEKFRKYMYSILDFTAVTKVEVSSETVRLIEKLAQDAEAFHPDVVVATVADRDVIYGLARMAQTLSDEGVWERGLFRSRDEAENWIRERTKERFGIDDLTMRPSPNECTSSQDPE